ncbi:MAG: Transcriptional regulator [Myxococcaceae bacterium]|nr:Transcriptional regulator [Myxococcaceae bacterium]
MVRTIVPSEVEALVAAGGLDIVDVREPHEWATGHVPGARLVPLARLQANPDAAHLGSKVLFVCASGMRSATAAELADKRGTPETLTLAGGTVRWAAEGLPIVRPAPPASPSAGDGSTGASSEGATEGEGDTELNAVVGENLRELRTQRGFSLDVLAGLSGVGRQTLGQIELGRAQPSVATLWKIARAFDVPFSALLARPAKRGTTVLRRSTAKRLVSADGRFSSRALFSLGDSGKIEFYELWLAGHGREDAEAHAPGTRENLVVTSGRLMLTIGAETLELTKGDAIVFTADVAHSYVNPDSEECWMNLVMTYHAES